MKRRYRALRMVIGALRVVAVLVWGLNIVFGWPFIISYGRGYTPPVFDVVVFIAIRVLAGGIAATIIFAVADRLSVAVDTEENTRAAVALLNRISRQLPPLESGARTLGGVWDEEA